jgi:exonuclease III
MQYEPANLSIATHNVRGLLGAAPPDVPTKVHALCRIWMHRKVDIVCLQETWITTPLIAQAEFHLNRASMLLGGGGWVPFWTPANSRHSCGVAILVRSALLSSGSLQVGIPCPHATGRILTLPMSWGSHDFICIFTYVPCAAYSTQRNLITSHLTDVAATPGLQI